MRHHLNFDLGGPTLIDGTTAVDIGDVPWDVAAFEANRAAIRHGETVLAARSGASRAEVTTRSPFPCCRPTRSRSPGDVR
jgi:hypothetical protein